MIYKMICEDNLCRPGGFALTEELIKWIPAGEEQVLVDIGCGLGDSLLYIKKKYPKMRCVGLDPGVEEQMPAPGISILQGMGERLPLDDQTVDIILMECSLSRMGDSKAAWQEIRRVLKPGGRVLISDMYLKGSKVSEEKTDWLPEPDAAMNSHLGRLESVDALQRQIKEAGFYLVHMQDVSRVLGDWVAQKIMDGRKEDICSILGVDRAFLRRWKLGYYIAVAEISPLGEMLRYVKERSPFYKELYQEIDPDTDFSKEGVWAKIPFTCAADIRKNPSDLVCVSPKEIARIITLKSSGSEGLPKRIFFTEEDLERTADFFDRGIRALVEAGDRVAVFMEGPTHFSVGGLLKEGLSRLPAEVFVCGLIRDYHVAEDQARGMDTLIGVPSQIYRLAKLYPMLRPKTVLLSADYVADSLKERIECIWHCRVFTHWGMSETGYGGAVQCRHREGYHLRDDDLLVEIIDPNTDEEMPLGEEGEVVVTTLHRRGMPLIRYRTGDLGRLLPGTCPCGYLLPRLDRVRGRLGGGIELPGGRLLRIGELDEVLYALPILGYQSAWNAEQRRLTIAVELEKDQTEGIVETIREKLQGQLGHSLEIEIIIEETDLDHGRGKKMILQKNERK